MEIIRKIRIGDEEINLYINISEHDEDLPGFVYERALDYARLFKHDLGVCKIAEMWHMFNPDTRQVLCSYTPDAEEIQDFRGLVLDRQKTPVAYD
jgi:hypothetical protein